MCNANRVYIIENDGVTANGSPARENIETMSITQQLETPEEHRQRKKSHMIVYFTAFIMSIGFSLVLTSVWSYLKQVANYASLSYKDYI